MKKVILSCLNMNLSVCVSEVGVLSRLSEITQKMVEQKRRGNKKIKKRGGSWVNGLVPQKQGEGGWRALKNYDKKMINSQSKNVSSACSKLNKHAILAPFALLKSLHFCASYYFLPFCLNTTPISFFIFIMPWQVNLVRKKEKQLI